MTKYTSYKLHPVRKLFVDVMDLAIKHHNIHGTFELDITLVKRRLKELQKEGKVYSFTAYLTFCLAQVLEHNKSVLAMRWKGFNALYFDEVDINTLIEKRINKDISIPISLIIRNAGRKTLDEINTELREARKKNPLDIEGVKERRKLVSYPRFIRRFLLKRILRNPFKLKKYFGTAAITSLSLFTDNSTWHGIPIVANPVCLLPAGRYKKVVIEDGVVVQKDYCSFTLTLNHDIMDGAPATRLASDFKYKIESGYGLE